LATGIILGGLLNRLVSFLKEDVAAYRSFQVKEKDERKSSNAK
jgi:hypothetical protein